MTSTERNRPMAQREKLHSSRTLALLLLVGKGAATLNLLNQRPVMNLTFGSYSNRARVCGSYRHTHIATNLLHSPCNAIAIDICRMR